MIVHIYVIVSRGEFEKSIPRDCERENTVYRHFWPAECLLVDRVYYGRSGPEFDRGGERGAR